jgi:integrase
LARAPEGWKLRKPKGRKTYSAYWTVNGARDEKSTGTGDFREAQKAAERLYADAVQRAPAQKLRVVKRGDAPPLDELIATWLAGDSTLDADTVSTWTTYGRHWCAHWGTLADLTDATALEYRNKRLTIVQGTTVRKECGALRRFARWCEARGYLPRQVIIPGVPSKAIGTAYAKKTIKGETYRRRKSADDLSPAQVKALIAVLPEMSASKKVTPFPIRARFVVQYETSLRPSTVSALSVPEHYSKGQDFLNITADIDKSRWARQVPLSDDARAALDAVCPAEGLIFGDHDYREHVAKAAASALPKEVADRFCGAHLRSARLTHSLEVSPNLAGVGYLAGQRSVHTTALYARQSARAARAVLDAFRGQSPNSVDSPAAEAKTAEP